MAGVAVLAAALTNHAAHAKSLFVNGIDVLKQPGTPGNRFGVPIGSITVDEAGPGGVSSMIFTLQDPGAVWTFSQGDEVRYENHVTGKPTFRGWVTTPTVVSDFGAQGRSITVQCTGVEAILDWTVVPAVTFAAGLMVDAVQSLCAQASWGAPGIRPFSDSPAVSSGSQAFPLSSFQNAIILAPVTTPAGTLRAAIQFLCDVSRGSIIGNETGSRFYVTVDFWLGLRGWIGLVPADHPADYVDMTVTIPEGAQHTVDGGSVIHGVLVIGGNAAGSGLVPDGTGIPGAITTLADSTILTRADRDARAFALLAGATAELSGSLAQLDFAPAVDVHPGSLLSLTSPNTGATGDYTIMGVSKSFNPSGRENWSVTYGALPPSAAALLRRLTRATLS